jgi:hypothetical protein
MATRILLSLAAVFLGLSSSLGGEEEKGSPQWVLVVAPAFRAALAPLIERRRADGFDVVVVGTDEVLSREQLRRGEAGPLRARVQDLLKAHRGPSYVLLAGAVEGSSAEPAERTVVPLLPGTQGRMKGGGSDNGYGCLGDALLPAAAVGRFPARTEAEARAFVEKTLRFEHQRAGAWRNRLTLFVGNPGGGTAVEKRFAEWFVRGVAGARFDRVHPSWTARILIHAPGSPFNVPTSRLNEAARSCLEDGQLFSFYLGHSGASGLWSAGAYFMRREDWSKLRMSAGAGVLFSCGCHGCELDEDEGGGYGFAAARNPQGPAAVIGAHGESYGAMGQLAIDGLLQCLGSAAPPERLGEYWLAVKNGLAKGPIDGISFWLYDQADGSRGTVTLEAQRLEHLEMWMLLGDPALRLPLAPPEIAVTADAEASPGGKVKVRGELPSALARASVRLRLERPLGSAPLELAPLPEDSAAAEAAMLSNHAKANDVEIAAIDVQARGGRFEGELAVPAAVPWPRLVVRALAASGDAAAYGVASVRVVR